MVLRISSSLNGHLSLLYSADPNIRSFWMRASRRRRARYLKKLACAESCRLKVTSDAECERLHAAADAVLKSQVADVRDRAFPEPPPVRVWLRLAADAHHLHQLCATSIRKLTPIVRLANDGQPCFCYGGVKPKMSIDRKIREYAAGTGDLDLWDLSRCRIVVRDVRAVSRTSQAIVTAFNSCVVRYHDYYRSPRRGWQEPYRAVHIELRIGDAEAGEFVEVQILTEVRDAIGMLDHTIIHCRTLDSGAACQEKWLRNVSFAANILDAGLAE